MIDSNINKLISIAERQSDQRLAQELNPQTQTGLLGPAFISASELSYRKKIRDEAQAQPMRSPSIVQQLAQSAMSPMQPMPTAPMPMQQPMPMPQQPMQRFQAGGVVYGNPFLNLVEGEPTDVLGNYPFSFDGSGNVVQTPMTTLPSSSTTADELIEEVEKDANRIGPPEEPFLQPELDKLVEIVETKNKEIQEGIEERRKQQEERRRKRNIQVDQDRLLNPIRTPQPDPLAGQDLRINPREIPGMPDAPPTGINPQAQAAGPDVGFQNVDPATLPQKFITQPPTAQDIYDSMVNSGTDPDANKKNDINKNKQNQLSDDDKAQLGNIKTMESSGVGSAAQKDIAYAASSDYQDLINKAIAKMTDEKGRMQNKWLRIAAGAFNAAQKGSPTLLGGLADLGAGVTEQLLALDADEQKQAQELFALYSAREKLRLDSYNSKYDLQRNQQTDLAANTKSYLSSLQGLLNSEISDDFTEQDAYAATAISYADMGVKDAQYTYARMLKEIQGEILNLNADTELTNAERQEKLDSYLKDNTHLRRIYDNYLDRRGKGIEEWLEIGLTDLE
jgi:hypothetical protein